MNNPKVVEELTTSTIISKLLASYLTIIIFMDYSLTIDINNVFSSKDRQIGITSQTEEEKEEAQHKESLHRAHRINTFLFASRRKQNRPL
jgi:hypothetical protein